MKQRKGFSILVLVLLAALLTPIRAHADVAPPEQPPGASIFPGRENTQVRMVAETVTLTVLSRPAANQIAQAATVAVFTMRNLGSVGETMEARFPLTYWNSRNNSFSEFAEINDIQIFVNQKQVSTHRINADFTDSDGETHSQAPWAAFDVTFPPETDVNITVKYTTNGYGYEPYFALRYILETGAGWKGTIGSADVIIKLPYAATEENILLTEETGFSKSTPGAQLTGNDVRWHFEDFEPVKANNIMLSLVIPSYWQKVLDARAQTRQAPNDGEAWGQLGKAIKESIRAPRGYLREDVAGRKLYQEAVQAYEKSVELLPKDALWHYGFADLLWSRNFYLMVGESLDVAAISRTVDELRQSLALDPKNEKALALANWISSQFPWAMRKMDGGYDYPVLTATPTVDPSTETPTLEATSTLTEQNPPTQTAVPAAAMDAPVSPTKTPKAGLPLCGGAGLIVLPALAVFWLAAKRKR